MPVFQVSSRTLQPPGPAKKRPTRARGWRNVILRVAVGGLVIAALATLLPTAGLSCLFFLLLPVCVSILTTRSYLYKRKVFLLTTGMALIYFTSVTGWELLTHRPSTPEYIVVTTTLALAVLFELARNYIQAFLEHRFPTSVMMRPSESLKPSPRTHGRRLGLLPPNLAQRNRARSGATSTISSRWQMVGWAWSSGMSPIKASLLPW